MFIFSHCCLRKTDIVKKSTCMFLELKNHNFIGQKLKQISDRMYTTLKKETIIWQEFSNKNEDIPMRTNWGECDMKITYYSIFGKIVELIYGFSLVGNFVY